MDVTSIRFQVVESQETTMARFLHGLNREIQDTVELHDYTSFSLSHKSYLQLKRYGKRSYPNTSSSWKGKERKEDKPRSDKSLKKGNASSQG
ncbi:hypothetical protein CR513_37359, partial [Mucuna pruriens]